MGQVFASLSFLLLIAAQPDGLPVDTCLGDKVQCDALGGARQRAILGVDSLETLAGENVRIIRIFTQTGFGGRYGAISFVRRPRHEPMLEIATGATAGGMPALSVPISVDAWDQANLEAAHFDAPNVPPMPRPDAPPALPCLHAWSERVEVIDRPYSYEPMRIRQITQSQCASGSTYATALLLTQQAKKLIPSCASLDEGAFPDTAALLMFCASTQGDKAAAAQARNVYGSPWLEHPRTADYHEFIQYHFYDSAEMTWPGEPGAEGSKDVATLWALKFSKYHLVPISWTGLDDTHVEVQGLIQNLRGADLDNRQLHFTMIMTKENGFDFRVRKMTVQEK